MNQDFKKIYEKIIEDRTELSKRLNWREILRICGISEFEFNNKSFWQRAKFRLLLRLIESFLK